MAKNRFAQGAFTAVMLLAVVVPAVGSQSAAAASGSPGGGKSTTKAAPPAGPDASGVPQSVWATQSVLDGIAVKVGALGKSDPQYSNVEVDAVADSLTVYLTSGAATSDQAKYAKLVPSGIQLKFASAALSAIQQDALNTAVQANEAALQADGMAVNEWGVQTLGGPYVINYAQVAGAPTAMAAMTDAKNRLDIYGPGSVIFVAAAAPKALSRSADTAPFYGGDNAFGPIDGSKGSSDCTSGFTGKSSTNGSDYILVAWHCTWPGSSNNAMWNGNRQTGSYFGPVTTSDPTADIA